MNNRLELNWIGKYDPENKINHEPRILNERLRICIEKFDDIALSNNGESPCALIQTKHHSNGHGDLFDKSVDLWRTIKIWIDHVSTYGLENVKFVIITTASAPENSAASFLRNNQNRDTTRAFKLLKQAGI